MAFIYDLTDTWNNAGISFNGIKLNATDTASAAGSKLLDLQISGASKFTVGKTGTVIATGLIESTVGGFKFPDGTTQTTKATVNSVSGTGTVNGITLTGTVTDSGSLTLGGTLGNIANNQLTNSAITINGTSTPLGGSIAVGTVTSVSGTGTVSGLSLTGSITTSGSLTLGGTLVLTSGQVTDALGFTPYDATNPTGYITASALTPYLTSATAATTYQPLDGDLTAIAALAGTAGLVRKTAANTYALDTAVYITGITSGDVTTALGFTPYNATNPSGYLSSVSLTSNVTGTLPIANGGTGATTESGARTALGLGTAAVLNAGVANGVATLDGSGTVPTSQLPGAVLGGLNYQGTWNASTNTPTLASSTGSKGYYYVVSVAGSTNLNGITDWKIGDWAVYDGTAWQKVDNTDAVSSVNGFTGAVVLSTSDVAQGTNLYFTQAAARGSVSAGTGISYNSTTGVITNSAPDQTVVLTGAGTTVVTGTYPNFTITSNDSAVGTVTSVAASGGTTGLSFTGSPITTAGTLTLGGTLAVANGGTGATDAATALTNIGAYPASNPSGYTTNTGTVTSINLTAGTGISVSGGPVTSSGAITVTNTAPDQVVSLTAGTNVTITGTYPNFTIAASGGGGSGTVTSVAASGGTTGLTFTGSPITTSGTLTLGGTLAIANGGTNLTSYTTGDLVYASATNTLAKLPVGTSGYVLTTNGTVPSWGLVSLTNGVTGTLPVSRGGTGNASWTIGSLITFSSTTNSTEVVPGTSGYPLISNGTGTLPTYSQINITNATTGTLTTARGGTNLTSYTTGDLLYASATNTLSKLPIGASGSVLTSDGVNISWQAGGGGGGGVTSFRTTMSGLTPSTATTGAVTLAGTLGIANGGTGATTKAAAFNALSPITTTGDLIIGNGSNSNTRLPIGAFGRYLFSNGSTASWQPISVSASDISGTLQPYQGGTGTSSTPSNGQLLIGNGGGYSVANLTAGANITITNSFGGITIAASGGAPSGPYIAQIQFSDGMNFYNNGPTSPQQSPVVYWDAGMNVGSIWFYSPSGGYNASGGSIASITIQDNTGAYTSYNQGTDFSTFVNNWYANGFVVGIYGLSIVNSALRTLMANTAAQLGTPAIAPRSNNSFGPQSAVDASVSGGINFSYQSNGPIILYRGPAPGQYYLSFRSGNPTGDFGLSLNYLQFTDSTGAINTYYNNMDFYNYGASNDPNQHFYCEISGVSNPNLQALLDNTVIV